MTKNRVIYTWSGRVDQVLEEKTCRNRFGMVGTHHQPPSSRVRQLPARVWSVWLCGLGPRFCWTSLLPTNKEQSYHSLEPNGLDFKLMLPLSLDMTNDIL